MTKHKAFSKAIVILILLLIITYLFASAPPPLQDTSSSTSKRININDLFNIVAIDNNAARTLYTRSIVSEGKKQGLQFDEKWKEKDVQAGPLPALFLRETASNLKANHSSLNLFLGSDFPIAEVNRFNGIQKKYFDEIKKNGKPQFFYDDELKNYTAMFPDYATDVACVNCHNQHEKSPKKNWKKGDIMGATTWSYPKDSVTLEEMIKIVDTFRKSTKQTYNAFLTEASTFKNVPHFGQQWPSQGYFLPTPEAFVDSASSLTSNQILKSILYLHQ